jgi:hypothetical protein
VSSDLPRSAGAASRRGYRARTGLRALEADTKNLRRYLRTFDDQTIRVIDLKEAAAAAGGKMRTIAMGLAEQLIEDASRDFVPEQPSGSAP